MILVYLYSKYIREACQDYATQFDIERVQMKDFTAIIDKLPKTFEQYDNEYSLKWALEQQIKTKIDECVKKNFIKKEVDSTIIDI